MTPRALRPEPGSHRHDRDDRDDLATVAALLGRRPAGDLQVVRRRPDGTPQVIENAPFLHDGTPMPTRFWLVDPELRAAVSALEANGGVREAQGAVDPEALARAHARYAAERVGRIPADHAGPRPSGGVGGTRTGVKCLHAHLAWWLVGGDDPVGDWVASRLGLERGSERRSLDGAS
ncbi:MAG TPA: DUF501 domain-containing protein [Acidimicrobiales bacterium]|nr:DUF501 domain-containing protein [Acidimicrobiales bacterium]